MKNGVCPKCNSKTIYSQPQAVYFYQGHLHVSTGSQSSGVQFTSYVCTACGYFENYITDQSKLAEVASKWKKV